MRWSYFVRQDESDQKGPLLRGRATRKTRVSKSEHYMKIQFAGAGSAYSSQAFRSRTFHRTVSFATVILLAVVDLSARRRVAVV